MNKEIEIPEGYEARIEGNKVIIELKESEDEKIRKNLIELLLDTPAQDIISHHLELSEVLAYLEKHKEPHYTKRNELFDKCAENCDPEVMKEVSDKVDEMLGKEQKPAEWKEEDEGMLNCIIATLCEESHGGRESNDKMVTWLENRLKSFRPQPHWKPSEEQMKELLNALIPGKDFDCDILAELYEQLKRL